MSDAASYRDIYHAVRRANRAVEHVSKHVSKAPRPAVPRGWAAYRDRCVRAIIERNRGTRVAESIEQRLDRHLTAKARRIIDQRRLTTPAGWDTAPVRVVERGAGVYLVRADYWYEYSRRAGTWKVAAAYLIGTDDAGPWAVRVPGSCTSITGALDWCIPAPARKAIRQGCDTRRQGDILLVRRMRGRSDFQALDGTQHEVRARADCGYTVVHPEHQPVRLPAGVWTAYRLRQDCGLRGGAGD